MFTRSDPKPLSTLSNDSSSQQIPLLFGQMKETNRNTSQSFPLDDDSSWSSKDPASTTTTHNIAISMHSIPIFTTIGSHTVVPTSAHRDASNHRSDAYDHKYKEDINIREQDDMKGNRNLSDHVNQQCVEQNRRQNYTNTNLDLGPSLHRNERDKGNGIEEAGDLKVQLNDQNNTSTKNTTTQNEQKERRETRDENWRRRKAKKTLLEKVKKRDGDVHGQMKDERQIEHGNICQSIQAKALTYVKN